MNLFIVDDERLEAVDGDMRAYARVTNAGFWYRVYGVKAMHILVKYMNMYPEKKLTYDRLRLFVFDHPLDKEDNRGTSRWEPPPTLT